MVPCLFGEPRLQHIGSDNTLKCSMPSLMARVVRPSVLERRFSMPSKFLDRRCDFFCGVAFDKNVYAGGITKLDHILKPMRKYCENELGMVEGECMVDGLG